MSTLSPNSLPFALLVLELLTACNQLDPPDGPLFDSDSDCPVPVADGGTDDRTAALADFFPMADGNTWTYGHTGDTYWEESVTMTASFSDGIPGFTVADTPGPSGNSTRSFWVREGSSVMRVHKDVLSRCNITESVDYAPGFKRFDTDWLRQAAGDSAVAEYQRTVTASSDVDQSLAPEIRRHEYTIESTAQAVRVAAGVFEDCLKIRRDRIRGAGTDTNGGADNKMFWFCPGVGKVKEQNLTTPGRGDEELLSYSVASTVDDDVRDGHDALVRFTPESSGDNCAYGGTLFEAGTDNGDDGGIADDGVLDDGEVDESTFVCDGGP